MKNYTLTEIKPKIFFLNFKNSYDLAMHFVRCQEYYESPNPKFRGKQFLLLDFMEWYSKKYGNGIFTYPKDWAGFNIPDHIIYDIFNSLYYTDDRNEYDYEMWDVYIKCREKYVNEDFYIIGSVGKGITMKHEIAHGFFYTNEEYKKEMTKLVKSLDPKLRKSIYDTFKKVGYTPKVFIDECQAYMATGFPKSWNIKLNNSHKPFVKLYNKFYK